MQLHDTESDGGRLVVHQRVEVAAQMCDAAVVAGRQQGVELLLCVERHHFGDNGRRLWGIGGFLFLPAAGHKDGEGRQEYHLFHAQRQMPKESPVLPI